MSGYENALKIISDAITATVSTSDIEAVLSDEQRREVMEEWQRLENVSWFEALAICSLRSKGIESEATHG